MRFSIENSVLRSKIWIKSIKIRKGTLIWTIGFDAAENIFGD